MALPDELALPNGSLEEDGQFVDDITDAIDAASDQDHVTWLTSDGKRVAALVPVDQVRKISAAAVSASPVPRDEFSPEEIYTKLREHRDAGVISYMLPSDPLGERWVIGSGTELMNLDSRQATAWLLGANAILMQVSEILKRSRDWGSLLDPARPPRQG